MVISQKLIISLRGIERQRNIKEGEIGLTLYLRRLSSALMERRGNTNEK